MTTDTRRYFVGLLVFAVLLAVALVKWSPGDADTPAGSISKPMEARSERSGVTSQPTILTAETAPCPNPISAPISLPAIPSSPRTAANSDLPVRPTTPPPGPARFLTIPSLETQCSIAP